MDLDSYLKQPDSMSVAELAKVLDVHSDQIRHWRHLYANRRPSPENCVSIEKATKGAVSRQDLRPDDWARIWPELSTPKRRLAKA